MRDAEKIVERLNTIWNTQDGDATETLFAADAVHEDMTSGVTRGAPKIRELFEVAWRAMPDVRTEIRNVLSDGDQVVWEWTMTATQTGDFPDVPATGRRFTLRGVSIIRTRDGCIVVQRDYYDQATYLRQVGVLPAPD